MRIILFAIMAFATLRGTAQTTITGHLIDNEKKQPAEGNNTLLH